MKKYADTLRRQCVEQYYSEYEYQAHRDRKQLISSYQLAQEKLYEKYYCAR